MMKHVDAGVLNITYSEVGAPQGWPGLTGDHEH